MFASSIGNSAFRTSPSLPGKSTPKEISPWEAFGLKVIFHRRREKKNLGQTFLTSCFVHVWAAETSCCKELPKPEVKREKDKIMCDRQHPLPTDDLVADNSSCRSQADGMSLWDGAPRTWSQHAGLILMAGLRSYGLHLLCEKKFVCTNMCVHVWRLQSPASSSHPQGLSMTFIQGGGMPAVSKDPWGSMGSSYPLRNVWETHLYPHFCTADPQHRAESFQTDLWETVSPLTPKVFAGL